MSTQIVSVGAGTQSTAMCLLAAHGDIEPMPACGIFADTSDEPAAVYKQLEWLRSGVLPFPIYIARQVIGLGQMMEALANSRDDIVIGKGGTAPYFTINPDGSKGMLNRHCTSNYKIDVVFRAAKKLFPDETEFTQWIGISTDEAHRMKPSRKKGFTSRFPLAMELRMSRNDCLEWMERHGYPRPPRSACVFCPYHSNNEWRDLRDNHPLDWQKAVEHERIITHGLRGTRGERLFLHRSCVPLDEVDLDTPEDHGQMGLWGTTS